jgi:hypothetical protein
MEIPAFSTSKVEEYSKTMIWDSKKVGVIGATLSLRTNQTYLSGAQVDLIINGKQRITMNWNAFETIERVKSLDVLGSVLNGTNTFKVVYTIAYGALSPQVAIVNAELNLVLRGQREGTKDPVIEGGLTDDNFWPKIGIALRNHAVLLIAGTVAVGGSVLVLKSAIGRSALGRARDIFK